MAWYWFVLIGIGILAVGMVLGTAVFSRAVAKIITGFFDGKLKR